MKEGSQLKIAIWITVGAVITGLFIPVVASGSSPVPLLVGILAVAAAFGIPILLGRWRPISLAVWLPTYVIVYSTLSWNGVYIDGNFGGSDNRSVWYPAYCGEAYKAKSGRQKCSLRPFAWFFLPPLVVDRLIVHRTYRDAD
jgi:hypothetical protein